jgi:formamidopyrimidine-DNA glycosylase
MPELPEVETVRIGLQRLIVGRTIRGVQHDTPKSFPNSSTDTNAFLIGARVIAVHRRGKVLIIDLSTNYSLVTHLKMTGQLVFVDSNARQAERKRFGAGHPNESLIGTLPDRSTRVTVTFEDDSTLYFNDQRKFGWMRLLPTVEVPEIDFFKRLGPEPLQSTFTVRLFTERIMRRKKSRIKAVLLDQTVIAGIGNIYADESLWTAKIHPETRVERISKAKVRALHEAIVAVLRLSIEKGGSTDKNYVNAEGKRGSYIQFAKVFRKEGHACERCGTTILKMRSAGRGTHICPTCQKVAR